MKIFIASARESLDLVREVESWLQEKNHEPMPWDQPGLFPPGEQTFLTLINISKQVEGAIFLFGEDDKVWYRGDAAAQPRDNVLIEYGLFAGALGPRKAIICRHGKPKPSADLLGITVIDLSSERKARGRIELHIWSNRLASNPLDPAVLQLQGQISALEREKESLETRIAFEREKAKDLEKILQDRDIVDFSAIDLKSDGHWKLLYEFRYFEAVANLLASSADTPAALRTLFEQAGAGMVVDQIAWHAVGDPNKKAEDMNPQRNPFLARKALRVFRWYIDSSEFPTFVRQLPDPIQSQIDDLGKSVIRQMPQTMTARPVLS